MHSSILLVLSLVCTFFSGFQSIPICAWLQPFLLLQFIHNSYGNRFRFHLLLALLTHTVVSFFAFYSLFPAGSVPFVYRLPLQFLWTLAVWVVLLVPFVISELYRRRFRKAKFAQPLVFASLWATSWYVWNRVGKVGSLLSPAVSQLPIQPLVFTATLWGVDGITFLMGWFSALLHERLLTSDSSPDSSGKKRLVDMHKLHVKTFLGFLGFCFFYGSAKVVLFSGRFYQRDLSDSMSPTVPVSCLVGRELLYEDSEVMLNRTLDRVRAGDRIVMWTEAAVSVLGKEEKESLVSRAQEIARGSGAYLGITYSFITEKNSTSSLEYNMLDLILPDGSIGFSYAKAHLVPFMEDGKAGELVLPVVDTELGRLGGAICFDFEFPDFIRQAGQKRVDIMLQAVETWGTTGPYVYNSDTFRAVENGFTWFRCSTGGVSGIVSPFLQVYDYREAVSNATLAMTLPISKKAWTFYPEFGFLFSWLIVGLALLHVAALYLPRVALESVLKFAPDKLLLYLTGEPTFEEFFTSSDSLGILYLEYGSGRP